MPTGCTYPERGLKNTRSPGRRDDARMCRVAAYCWAAVRGSRLPNRAKTHMVRPEQSKRRGPTAPHWYGAPRLVAATCTALWPTPADTVAWAGSAAADVTPVRPTVTIATMARRPRSKGRWAARSNAFMGRLQAPLARHDLSGSGTCLPGSRDLGPGGRRRRPRASPRVGSKRRPTLLGCTAPATNVLVLGIG